MNVLDKILMNTAIEWHPTKDFVFRFPGDEMTKLLRFDELSALRRLHSGCTYSTKHMEPELLPGKKIVLCHGVFDVLHAGHLAYFKAAKAFGDILVTTISTDAFVNKGPGRPYFTDKIRAEMVAALEIVDYVAISDHPTAVSAIEALQPDFYVKGQDYRDATKDVTGGILEEREAVEYYGGKLVFTDEVTHSSSALVNRFFLERTDEQTKVIAAVKELGGYAKIEELFEQIEALKVCVVGEMITDTYRFVEPQNISSKSPSISAKFIYEENYAGGSYAIARHLADFCKSVSLVSVDSNTALRLNMLGLDDRVEMQIVPCGTGAPRKIRYIAQDKSQRIFEVTEIDEGLWRKHSPKLFKDQMLDLTGGADIAILADFGHGIFEDEVLEACSQIRPFIALNVQTNSSNYGFNPFHKHTRFDYLSLDARESRVAYHDRISGSLALGRRARRDLNPHEASVSLTLGSQGAYYFPFGIGHEYFAPAFAEHVVDATGAGDAYFALTAVLARVSAPHAFIPFLGNIYAGLKTKIIGNKSSVTKAEFMKAVKAILM